MQATVIAPHPLATDLAAFLRYLHHTSLNEWFRVVASLELSLSQVKALHMLDASEELTVKDLAASLSLSLPAASRAVDGLLVRGFVERRGSMADRRCKLVSLTSEGRAVVKQVYEARIAGLEEFVATLPEDSRDALRAALKPIVERIP